MLSQNPIPSYKYLIISYELVKSHNSKLKIHNSKFKTSCSSPLLGTRNGTRAGCCSLIGSAMYLTSSDCSVSRWKPLSSSKGPTSDWYSLNAQYTGFVPSRVAFHST